MENVHGLNETPELTMHAVGGLEGLLALALVEWVSGG